MRRKITRKISVDIRVYQKASTLLVIFFIAYQLQKEVRNSANKFQNWNIYISKFYESSEKNLIKY